MTKIIQTTLTAPEGQTNPPLRPKVDAHQASTRAKLPAQRYLAR